MKAFLVVGPESSGTRLMTSLLMAAGCYGDDGHEQRLDNGIPDNEPLIVWRRSIPHSGEWVDIPGCISILHRAGFMVRVIVMSRDWHSMAISQEQAPHADSLDNALENIQKAYRLIFAGLFAPYEVVNYEALTQRPTGTMRYLCQRIGLPTPAKLPAIFDGNAKYYPAVSLADPVSQLCSQSQFEEPTFKKWLAETKMPPGYYRKAWELAYICQALDLAGMLQSGKCGLGFGVGREKLPAVFAARGVAVLATDQPDGGDWIASRQYSASYDDLPFDGICKESEFSRLVLHGRVDMNSIPADLLTGEYDFIWSTNSLDHLGSIPAGLAFIRNSLDCLKPGGVAVHTTEFNTDSDDETLEEGPVVLFRERDVRGLVKELTEAGHYIELNLTRGNGPIDLNVDRPPYGREAHIRIAVGEHVTTSIGLIIRKQ